jgi:hypothetical protein
LILKSFEILNLLTFIAVVFGFAILIKLIQKTGSVNRDSNKKIPHVFSKKTKSQIKKLKLA